MRHTYSYSCTRSPDLNTPAKKQLQGYFNKCGIEHTWLVDQKSIFTAYENAIKSHSPHGDNIYIFCHDDIEIWDDPDHFQEVIERIRHNNSIGFIGVAGTTYLGKDAVWWEIERRKAGLHKGLVFQGDSRDENYPNYFGPVGEVVVLDGVFLALNGNTADRISWEKPESFPQNWDFYDIYYTAQAHMCGLHNYVVPILTLHNSPGVMRESWQINRTAFQNIIPLPLICH